MSLKRFRNAERPLLLEHIQINVGNARRPLLPETFK